MAALVVEHLEAPGVVGVHAEGDALPRDLLAGSRSYLAHVGGREGDGPGGGRGHDVEDVAGGDGGAGRDVGVHGVLDVLVVRLGGEAAVPVVGAGGVGHAHEARRVGRDVELQPAEGRGPVPVLGAGQELGVQVLRVVVGRGVGEVDEDHEARLRAGARGAVELVTEARAEVDVGVGGQLARSVGGAERGHGRSGQGGHDGGGSSSSHLFFSRSQLGNVTGVVT